MNKDVEESLRGPVRVEDGAIATLLDQLDEFTRSYAICALWSTNDNSTPSGGEPLDKNYDLEHIADRTLRQMITDCALFQRDDALELAVVEEVCDAGRAGHNFWTSAMTPNEAWVTTDEREALWKLDEDYPRLADYAEYAWAAVAGWARMLPRASVHEIPRWILTPAGCVARKTR